MNLKKPLGTLALTGLMLGALLVNGGTAHATDDLQSADWCDGIGYSDKDHRAYDDTMKTNSVARTAPDTDCSVVFSSTTSRLTVDYHCYRVIDGYHWTYLRLKGSTLKGWVRGDRLTDSGSNVAC